MDTNAKQQYMDTLRKEYHVASKKRKGELLDEYCKRTGEDRKYAIKKLRNKVRIKKQEDRKKRPKTYDGLVVSALVAVWNIFDRPCGQRLRPLLTDEIDRLRTWKELTCTDDVATKLKCMSSATIDRRLHHEKETLLLNLKHKPKRNTPLLSQVPVKTVADLDRQCPGSIQIDCVEHCGLSASGEYIHSLTTVDILTGWWEGEALMGKGQERALAGMQACKERSPIDWKEMHPDNGSNLLNWHVVAFAKATGVVLSRSRPYKKNDNCYVEQKNRTHVRHQFGYLRFDSEEEQVLMNDLYSNELRLYKNFFQPVMKLTEKVRVGGKIHRKYDTPQTPYQRVMQAEQIDGKTKARLRAVYEDTNPAQLKRVIDTKVLELYRVYQQKNGSSTVDVDKKLSASLVSYYLMQQL